jgi:hypothetical protein
MKEHPQASLSHHQPREGAGVGVAGVPGVEGRAGSMKEHPRTSLCHHQPREGAGGGGAGEEEEAGLPGGRNWGIGITV